MRSSLIAACAQSAGARYLSQNGFLRRCPMWTAFPRACGATPFRWKGVDGHDTSACLPPSLAKGGATTADWIGRERRQPARRASAKDGASKRTRAQRERGWLWLAPPGRRVHRHTLTIPGTSVERLFATAASVRATVGRRAWHARSAGAAAV